MAMLCFSHLDAHLCGIHLRNGHVVTGMTLGKLNKFPLGPWLI